MTGSIAARAADPGGDHAALLDESRVVPDDGIVRVTVTSAGRVRLGIGRSRITLSPVAALILCARLEVSAEAAEAVALGAHNRGASLGSPVRCPSCDAAPGRPCVSPAGRLSAAQHVARARLAVAR